MTTKISWYVLIGVILVALLLWLLFYSTLGWFHGRVLVSLSITIVAALFGVVLRWAISEGAVEGVDVVVPVLITGAVSAALALAVLGVATAPTPTPKGGVTEYIVIDCDAMKIIDNKEEANTNDTISWSVYNPTGVVVSINFASSYPGRRQNNLTIGSFSDPPPLKPGVHKYAVKCGDKPINQTPMIQIPRQHP